MSSPKHVVNSAVFRPGEGAFGDDCLVIEVTVENRDESAQSYNTFDWRIQTGGGQVLDAGFCGFTLDSNLGSGDLISGGSVSGTVGFEVGPGSHFLIYETDAFSTARGIWQVEVE